MVHRLAQLLAFSTFVLLFAGGLVTSTDSGLAVPDWPLSFGSFFPPMVGGIRFEHTHRVIAASVGMLTLLLTFWIGFTEKRPWVRGMSIGALGLVVLQGVLGGMTVLHKLPASLSIAHACLGPTFFSVTVCLALLTSPLSAGDRPGGAVSKPVLFLTAVAFFQILLGAVVRHTNRGLIFHIAWAFVVFSLAGLVVGRVMRQLPAPPRIMKTAIFLGLLVTVEFFLGIGAFAFTRTAGMAQGWGPVIFPTLHQTLGALVLATSASLAFRGIA